MNIILLKTSQLENKPSAHGKRLVYLNERQSRHCIEVLKVQPGNRIQVGLLNDTTGTATIRSIPDIAERDPNKENGGGGAVTIELDANSLGENPPQASNVVLHLALTRPKMMRRMLRTATELGVKEIHIINSAKVDKSYWQSPLLSAENLEQTLIEGLEQSRDTRLPNVQFHKLFRPYAEDALPSIIKNEVFWIAHPYNTCLSISDLRNFHEQPKRSHLAIGPEGGFNAFEIDCLINAGGRSFNAGRRIMRCETFLPWIVGALED